MDRSQKQTQGQPKQEQEKQPGVEGQLDPQPLQADEDYQSGNKLVGKVALITGGDSGIGRSVAIGYAKEGADVAISYLEEHEDAEYTKKQIEEQGRRAILIPGDVGEESVCKDAVERTVNELGQLDILVNNAAEQHPTDDLMNITAEQWESTFKTNIHSIFYMTKAAIPHLKKGSSIINTASINPYTGNAQLVDYTATKGAVVAFTRSMAKQLVDKGIRVNGVAPGPIWTPLIPSTFGEDKVEQFGTNTPMGRPGQPVEHVGSYVLLASDDSTYMTGQFIHINGGLYTSS
ncbi:NAD(P)-dependent oxidoreductase [Halobacillus halophilus]|uniref:Short-chain dehydrogenase/reductase family protein n=1 Tax=Halobacillus halophilus (strain ATCC 35676 / DSM 2266 / JCM 20832 / KCTC 3685 / LMG 17431 / NBRC 102448 / NCIMB 2269) TaxID=866895 RepID=I0JTM6_HALH3|nr:SDR family oxidoreductase [Halobacillus halophilus]ASF41407.1 NAD(P)-dependent oxidoreductase [Halobacillus halophilus]CCG47499.1 short-chain dehydrogenase/reductase family protein [Halobacillus halophilus DSM 2266]